MRYLILTCLFFGFLFNASQTKLVTREDVGQLFNGDEWLVKFYADWCPACQRFAPIWDELEVIRPSDSLSFAEVDIEQSRDLAVSFSVTHLPTVFHVKDGEVRAYEGSLMLEDLQQFIEQEEWKQITPYAWYRHPNGLTMKFLSYVSILAEYALELHSFLMTKYELTQSTATAILIAGGFATSIVSALMMSLFFTMVAGLIFGKPQSAKKASPAKKAQPKQKKAQEEESTKTSSGKKSEAVGGKKSELKKRAVRE